MPQQLTTIVLGAIVLVTSLAAWIAGLYYVRWDATRRGLPEWQRVLWLVLALWPLAGFTLYVLAVARTGAPDPGPAPAQARPLSLGPRKRITLARPPAALRHAPHVPTLPVTDVRGAQPGLTIVSTAPVSAVARSEPPEDTAPKQLAYHFQVLEGPHAGQEFVVRDLPARIGRGPEAAIRLDDDLGVSRRHAELYHQAGVLRLRDVHSVHGTAVNGFTVDDKGLAPGDQIRVGHSLLAVRVEDRQAAPNELAGGPGQVP